MSDLMNYWFKVSLVSSLLIMTYWLLFRRLTFHTVNRLILISIIPVACLLPLFDFQVIAPVEYSIDQFEWIDHDVFAVAESESNSDNVWTVNIWSYLEYAYWVGFLVGVVLLVMNAAKLFQQIHQSRKISSGRISVVLTDSKAVFSCFKWVFVPNNLPIKDRDLIMRHEKAHIQLGHSWDLLITELFIILTWFNPFVYLFRKLVRCVHEYQVDDIVTSGTVLKSDYLSLMLENLMTQHRLSLTSNFKSSTIKNRIDMITKHKSSKFQLVRYAVLIPVVAGLLMSFNSAIRTLPLEEKPLKEVVKVSFKSPLKKIDITSRFGVRTNPFTKEKHFHPAVDLRGEIGTEILAPADGIIKQIKSNDRGFGKSILMSHAGGYTTFYAHLDSFNVRVDQAVKQGDVIGYVGNTGKTTGPHLHYAIKHDGEDVNPEPYLSR